MLNAIKKTHASDFTWKDGKATCSSKCIVHKATRFSTKSWTKKQPLSHLLHYYGFPCHFSEGIDEVQKAMVTEKEDNEKNDTSNIEKLIEYQNALEVHLKFSIPKAMVSNNGCHRLIEATLSKWKK